MTRILNGEVPQLLRSFEKFRWPDSVAKEVRLALEDGEDGMGVMARALARDTSPAYRNPGVPAIGGMMLCSEWLRGLHQLSQAELDNLARKMRESLKEAVHE